MKIFLLSLELCGIKNIEKSITFHFYKKTISNDFDQQNYCVKAIYGENGAGKTAVITAVSILRELILNPGYLSDSKTQMMLHNLVNKSTQSLDIAVKFLNIDWNEIIEYHVCVENSKEEGGYVISREDLAVKSKPNSKAAGHAIYSVNNGELHLTGGMKDETEGQIKEVTANLLTQRTVVSLFSRIYRKTRNNELGICLMEVVLFATLLETYLNEEDQHNRFFVNQSMQNMLDLSDDADVEWKTFLRGMKQQMQGNVMQELVRKTEYGEYENQVGRLERFLRIFKPDLQGILIDRAEDGEFYHCTLDFDYGTYKINEEFESTGIKKLVMMFEGFDRVSSGGIVFIDELDSNINDVYLCKLIEYVAQYGKGQLCFTAHNLSPMRFLKKMKKSIDFLTSDNRVVSWKVSGNFTPENQYRNGMIEGCPLNVEASDFIGILGKEE